MSCLMVAAPARRVAMGQIAIDYGLSRRALASPAAAAAAVP